MVTLPVPNECSSTQPHESKSPSPPPSTDPTLSPTTVGQRTRPPSERSGSGEQGEECMGAMVFCGYTDGPGLKSWCGTDGMPSQWGWSNYIGSTEHCILGVEMEECDTDGGDDVGTVEVLVESDQFKVSMSDGWVLKEYHASPVFARVTMPVL